MDAVLHALFGFLACIGFAVIYNIHGLGILICALGGALGCLVHALSAPLFQSDITQTLAAAVVIAAYSEIMARIRKCPVTGYLLVAIFPLVPGASIYYTMGYAINGELDAFLPSLIHTIGVGGAIAVGALLVSTIVRMTPWYHAPAPRQEVSKA